MWCIVATGSRFHKNVMHGSHRFQATVECNVL
jgi:hypothetical protein